jgi:hypothetical protein
LLCLAKHKGGLIPAFSLHEEGAQRVDADLRRPFLFDLLAQVGDRAVNVAFLGQFLGASDAPIEVAQELPRDSRQYDDDDHPKETQHPDP